MGAGLKNATKNEYKKGSGASYVRKQNERRGTEWDIRLTTNESYTEEDIVNSVKRNKKKILWCLVGGAERGTAWEEKNQVDIMTLQKIAPYEHHHVCLVLHKEASYADVCDMFGTKYRNGKYVVVRDKRYTYKGWIVHATKIATKIDPTCRQVMEYGTRPVDADTQENRRKIRSIVRKYGDNHDKLSIGIIPLDETDIRNALKEKRDEKKEQMSRKRKIEEIEGKIEDLLVKKKTLQDLIDGR